MNILKALTNYHIDELISSEQLSERTKNVCKKGSLDTLYKILIYYLKNENFKKIQNCGEKTDKELIAMSEKFISEYNISMEDLDMSDENVNFEKFKFFCFENFAMPTLETEKFRQEFFDKKFPFYKYLLLVLSKVLNEREYFIFEHNFNYLIDKNKMTLQAIGNIYGITRERIRQISQMIPYKLEETIARFAHEQEYFNNYFSYKLDTKDDYILITSVTADKINEQEQLPLTAKFYALAFSVLYSKSYSMFQDKGITYANYFIINNEIYKQFDFPAFYNEVLERLSKRIEANYTVDFDQFLKKYFKKNETDIFSRIKTTATDILALELAIEVNDNNQVVFKRNTLVKLSESIVEILQEEQRPLKLLELHKKLATKTSRAPQNIESLRSSILSIDDIVAIGKTSTYSLIGWKGVKTGTIKELVKEYLEQFDEPKHISDISDFVIKYRDTVDKNVLSNLKLDKTGSFVFFKKGYIGLGNKKYKRLSGKHGQLNLL